MAVTAQPNGIVAHLMRFKKDIVSGIDVGKWVLAGITGVQRP